MTDRVEEADATARMERSHEGVALNNKSEAAPLEPLAERIRKGDRAAERELMELYGRRVFAVIFARLRDPEVAEDLTQETLMAALAASRNGKLLAAEKLPGYLRGTARNLCNNHLRGLSRKPVGIQVGTPSADPDPEVRFRRRELLTLVGRSLAELEGIDQKILLWSLVDRLSSEKIANQLGMRAETVRQRKCRALQRIRSRSLAMSQNPRQDHRG